MGRIGIRNHYLLGLLAARAIAAAALSVCRSDNATQSKKHADGNDGQHDEIRRAEQVTHAFPFQVALSRYPHGVSPS